MNADRTPAVASPCVAECEAYSGPKAGGEAVGYAWKPSFRELERAVAEAGSDTALVLLWKAYRYARDANRDVWDFALELETLLRAGVTHTDLRWLVAKGFAEHARELVSEATGTRVFGPAGGLHFAAESCLVLTPQGAQHVRGVLQGILVSSPILLAVAAEPDGHGQSLEPGPLKQSALNEGPLHQGPLHQGPINQGSLKAGLLKEGPLEPGLGEPAAERPPCWNPGRRELVWGDRLVKRYRVPAPNQERILCAFEEEGWPDRIDDPLPVRRPIDPRTRLHDAINRLNRHQHQPLLSFRGDGTGMGVFWEFRQSAVGCRPRSGEGVESSR